MKNKIGEAWSRVVISWGQIGVMIAIVTTLSSLGTFYVVVVKDWLQISATWFAVIIITGLIVFCCFVYYIGVPAYYKMSKDLLGLAEINRKLDILLDDKSESDK